MPMSPRLLRPRATGFNPRSISGLALWLDAADSASLYTTDAGPVTAVTDPRDIAGCVLWLDGADASTVTASGGSVSEWRDKTSGARHFTASSTAQPTYTATLNGRNVLTFNGSTNTMTGNAAAQDAIRNRAGYTFFAVSKVGSVAAGERLLCGFGTTVIFRAGQNGSSPYAGGRRVSGDTLENITGAASSLAVGSSYITSAIVNHTAQSLTGNLNGSGFASDTTYMAAGSSENTAMTASLGSQNSAYGFYNGDIAEVIIFDTALSTTDRARVESYLAAKWGISGVHAPATATNDPVGAWLDKSGNGRHATQATAAGRPVIGTLGSRTAASFAGANSVTVPAYPAKATSTYIYVSRNDDTADTIFQTGFTNQYHSHLVESTAKFRRNEAGTGGVVLGSNIGVGLASLWCVDYSNAALAVRYNGALVGATTTASTYPISDSSQATTLGRLTPTETYAPLHGRIAEFLVYGGRNLTDAEKSRLERYLASKWGITLAPQVANADAQDWINRVYGNGGTVSATTAAAVNTFCNSIDAVSGLRAKFSRLNLFCGTGLSACLVPLYRSTAVGGSLIGNATDTNTGTTLFQTADYNELGINGGLNSLGTVMYLNTGVPSNTVAIGNRHLSVYARTFPNLSFRSLIGAELASAVSNLFSISHRTATTIEFCASSGAAGARSGTINSGAYWIGSSSSATTATLYQNGGSPVSATVTTATNDANPILVFAHSRSTSFADPFGGRIAGYSIGAALDATEVGVLNNAMQAFQTALQRNV